MSVSSGNRQAEAIAAKSKLVQESYHFLQTSASHISDPVLRREVLDLLENPAPTFYLESPTTAAKMKVYERLLARRFIKAKDSRFPQGRVIDGIFPPVADPHHAPQPFWAAPGSAYDSHHSYPGGLVVHEAFNLRSALALEKNYRLQYPGMEINPDFIIAAPIWHDAMKAVVFQWNNDESEWPELTIASTGAHHILGIAEALHRHLPPRLVVAIAAAHGAPGFEPSGKIAEWLEAAAILAHVDAVQYGVLKKAPAGGRLELPWPIFPEATIDTLSDGDYVWTIPAAHRAIAVLANIARSELMMHSADLAAQPFNDLRNHVFSQMTQVGFYSLWLQGSTPAALAELRRLGLLPAK